MSQLKYTKPQISMPRKSEPSPVRSGVLWALALFSVIVAVAVGYLFAEQKQQISDQPANTERAAMQAMVTQLQDQNNELVTKLARFEQSDAIDSTTNKEMLKSLAEKEQEVKTLNEELSFYKKIVSPEGFDEGLGIDSFSMDYAENVNEYNYKLVLTQVGGGSLEARGTVLLRVQGTQDGFEKVLEWWDLRPDSSLPMPSFGFKYFQRMDGKIILPDGFIARVVLVKIIPDSTSLKSSEQSYTWDAVISGG